MRRHLNLLAVSALLGAAALTAAGSAGAHVSVDQSQPPAKGGYGIVRLIVPTESAEATTVGVTVTLPDGVDLLAARTLPTPGWTAAVETEPAGDSERVARIIWRAVDPGNGVKPKEFGEFTFSAGPWPDDVNTVALPADQVYSDGSVVSWNEIALDTATEPEHPAPVVTLGAPEQGHAHNAPAAASSPPPEAHTAAAPSDDESWWWRATSAVSLFVALGTAAALVLVRRRTRGAGS